MRWKAIDFDRNTITINHKVLMVEKEYKLGDKLKTASSYRTLPLIPSIKEDLIKWKKQVELNSQFCGNTYDQKWHDYVFVDETGTLLKPDYVSHGFNKILKKNDLKIIRLHDLRHSCASLLLASGSVNLKQIQDWLGHADFTTTANIYSHLDFSSKIQSANVIADIFKEEKKGESKTEDLLAKVREDMERLGLRDFNEYAAHFKEEREGENSEIMI